MVEEIQMGTKTQACAIYRPGKFQDTCSGQGTHTWEIMNGDPQGNPTAIIQNQRLQTQMWCLLDCEGHSSHETTISVGQDPCPAERRASSQAKVEHLFNFPLTCER